MRRYLIYRWLVLLGIVCLVGGDARSQSCGFSINTFYVVDDSGTPINSVKIEPVSSDFYLGDFKEHYNYKRITETYFHRDLRAYVVQHGLCGSHSGVVLKFSAPEFETTTQKVNMSFGHRGYVLNLSRKGEEKAATLTEMLCSEQPKQCVSRVELNFN